MRKLSFLFIFFILVSCTSNTILEEPKDLIPRDTMHLLIQDMLIANSAKHVKTINNQKKINYMPFIYDKYNIDSGRFQKSNFYYLSKIDLYEEMISNVVDDLAKRKEVYTKLSDRLDSIRMDSIKKSKIVLDKPDSLKIRKKRYVNPNRHVLKSKKETKPKKETN